jgi:hypothetical protein
VRELEDESARGSKLNTFINKHATVQSINGESTRFAPAAAASSLSSSRRALASKTSSSYSVASADDNDARNVTMVSQARNGGTESSSRDVGWRGEYSDSSIGNSSHYTVSGSSAGTRVYADERPIRPIVVSDASPARTSVASPPMQGYEQNFILNVPIFRKENEQASARNRGRSSLRNQGSHDNDMATGADDSNKNAGGSSSSRTIAPTRSQAARSSSPPPPPPPLPIERGRRAADSVVYTRDYNTASASRYTVAPFGLAGVSPATYIRTEEQPMYYGGNR